MYVAGVGDTMAFVVEGSCTKIIRWFQLKFPSVDTIVPRSRFALS